MKMKSSKRAIDKIYKRRNRYEIPDWQRQEVWGKSKKQNLIDSILKGWKLPKFYFLKTNDNPEEYEVVDGQQRLSAIFEFFDNELELSPATRERLGATYYRELRDDASDNFDDFEIEYDLIEDASDGEVKEFFQRLQDGLPLTSAEKLNSMHSNLRDFCFKLSKERLFSSVISVSDKRYGHFDIIVKAACIEIDGIEVGLRLDDMQAVFESQSNFSEDSEVAKRLQNSIYFLADSLNEGDARLRNRSFIQSLITLTCCMRDISENQELKQEFRDFVDFFLNSLSEQVEKGQRANDKDYLDFQRTISANTKAGPRIRHNVLVRKLLSNYPKFSSYFGQSTLAEAGIGQSVKNSAQLISEKIIKINEAYSSKNGSDLFKPTNKTVGALQRLAIVVSSLDAYKSLIEDLYFLLYEGPGSRLSGESLPASFSDINKMRNAFQHDLDHGRASKVRRKKVDAGEALQKYAGFNSPELLKEEAFVLVQANLLNAVFRDLEKIFDDI